MTALMDKINQLQDEVESLKLQIQEKDAALQLWKDIVQKLVLEKLDVNIETEVALIQRQHNEAKAESGRMGYKGNLVDERGEILSSPNLMSGETAALKPMRIKERPAGPEDAVNENTIKVTSKLVKDAHIFESDKSCGPSVRVGSEHSGKRLRRKQSFHERENRPSSSDPNDIIVLDNDTESTSNDILVEYDDLAGGNINIPSTKSIFEEGLGLSTTSPTSDFHLKTSSQQFLLSSVNKTVSEERQDAASVSRPPDIVPSLDDSNDPDIIVLATSTILESGATKIVQYEPQPVSKKSAAASSTDLGSNPVKNNSGSDISCILRKYKSFPPQEITIGPSSPNSLAISSNNTSSRKRKSTYQTSSQKSTTDKTSDEDLDDDGETWRKWTPDIEEVDVGGYSSAQNKTISTFNSVTDSKRIHLENFGVSTENKQDLVYENDTDRNQSNTKIRYRNESLIDIAKKTNRTVSTSKPQNKPATQSDIRMRSQALIKAAEISIRASGARKEFENDDIDDSYVKTETIEIETIDLDSDSSDDTHELYSSSHALNDHLDANEILNTEDSSDVSQDTPSVESIENEDSETAIKSKMEMFGNEVFVNMALRTHGFRNKLLLSAVTNWQKAWPQDKEAVEVKRRAAKNAIVMDDEKKIYKCSVCELCLTNSYNGALKHAMSHFVKRSYICGICKYKSSCRSAFVDHYKNPEYLNCFTTLAREIYDKNDFVGLKSKSVLHPKRSKPKIVDLKELKNCEKLKCKTMVKVIRCKQTDKFVVQYSQLEARLRVITAEMADVSSV